MDHLKLFFSKLFLIFYYSIFDLEQLSLQLLKKRGFEKKSSFPDTV